MSSPLVQESVGSLWFQDVQSAVDIKGATLSRWNEIKRQKDITLKRAGKKKFKEVLVEFRGRIRGVLTKCKTTQGVLYRKKDRINRVDEENLDQANSSRELEVVRKHMKKMAEIVVEIGNIFLEVSTQIEQIDSELLTARSTFSGQTPE